MHRSRSNEALAARREKAHPVRGESGPQGERRLSLGECRELLPPDLEIDDVELELLRDQLYVLAEVLIACARP
jgi:hypothetical protein